MLLTEDQQRILAAAVLAHPSCIRPEDKQDIEIADGLVEARRLLRDGDGYRAAPELLAAMAHLVQVRAEMASRN